MAREQIEIQHLFGRVILGFACSYIHVCNIEVYFVDVLPPTFAMGVSVGSQSVEASGIETMVIEMCSVNMVKVFCLLPPLQVVRQLATDGSPFRPNPSFPSF